MIVAEFVFGENQLLPNLPMPSTTLNRGRCRILGRHSLCNCKMTGARYIRNILLPYSGGNA